MTHAVASRLPVYLIHWDAPEWCRSSACSVLASVGVEVEVTVVDNGQREGPPLAEILPPGVRIITMPGNGGYTSAANAALDDWHDRLPDADFGLIGSHDLQVRPDTLARLLAVARDRPDCGLVAPALLAPVATSGGVDRPSGPIQVKLADAPDLVERDWAVGACLLLRRACVDVVGRFDERFGSYQEDVDYGLRVNAHGWKVLVVTSAEAWGLGTVSTQAIRYKAGNGVILAAKHRGPVAAVGRLGRLTVLIGRGLVAGVLPWRSTDERDLSRLWVRQRASALVDVVTSRRLIDVLRDRDGDAGRAGVG